MHPETLPSSAEHAQHISIAIITLNEQHNITECLCSCQEFNSITIVDAGSDDNTTNLIKASGRDVIHRDFTNFSEQKQFAIDQSKTDWILLLDADERLTPELIQEIKNLNLDDPSIAYAIPRRSYFLGKEIRYCGWYPDFVTRLFNRTKVRLNKRPVHESVEGFRLVVKLHNPILHFSYQSMLDVARKIEQYSRLGAQQLLHKRSKINPTEPFLRAGWAALKTLVIKFGFLDGWSGIEIARMNYQTTKRKYQIARDSIAGGRNT